MPVDGSEPLRHEDANHDQRWAGGECGDAPKQRREEHRQEVEQGDPKRRQPCAAALVDARHRLAVRGDGAGAQDGAEEGADGVGPEGGVAPLEGSRGWVNQARAVRRGVEEAHGAEEVDVQEDQERDAEVLHVEVARVEGPDGAAVHVPREAGAVPSLLAVGGAEPTGQLGRAIRRRASEPARPGGDDRARQLCIWRLRHLAWGLKRPRLAPGAAGAAGTKPVDDGDGRETLVEVDCSRGLLVLVGLVVIARRH
mmetsp:Transcript_17270/g.56163  ORF Transcript_17270/g.56163 Transcript_17270/m.56163 type:complete len:254 (+) Transcript_17270:498-1259(+)